MSQSKSKEMLIKGLSMTKDESDDPATGTFEGYLSTYGNTDRDGDVIEVGAFTDSVKAHSTVPLLYQHNTADVLGKLDLNVDSKGLYVKGTLNLKNPHVVDVYDLLKMGALTSMSIGMGVQEFEPLDMDRPYNGWKILRADVYEGSIVSIPANEQATIDSTKSASEIQQKLKAVEHNYFKLLTERVAKL